MLYSFTLANDRPIVTVSHNYHIRPELHPTRLMSHHDIFYVIDGYCSVRLEEEELLINPGEIAVLPAGIPHYSSRPYRANTHTIFAHFGPREGDRRIAADEEAPRDAIILGCSIHARSPVIYQYFQDLEKTYWSGAAHRDPRCSAILGLLLMECGDCYKNEGLKRDQLMLEMLALLAEHPQRFYSIPELAAEAVISPKSLCSRFKAETGQTIHQYQMNKKLNQIAALLRGESDASLKILADNFGFYDEFHLSSSFKKKFGVCPRQFRYNLNYAFDPSVAGTDNRFSGMLETGTVFRIVNDNVRLISARRIKGTGEQILLRLQESRGQDSRAEIWLNLTAAAARMTGNRGGGVYTLKTASFPKTGGSLPFPSGPGPW
jgi:AraC-like DNA-binding protein